MGSASGVPDAKLLALADAADGPLTEHPPAEGGLAEGLLFDERERAALAYAEAMSFTDQDVDDVLFARLRESFTDDELVELTAVIAWENASSKFNRALRIPSQGLWQRRPDEG